MIKGLIKKVESLSTKVREEEITEMSDKQLNESMNEINEMKKTVAEIKKGIEAAKQKRMEDFSKMDREAKFAECVKERESNDYDKQYTILLYNWLVDEMTGVKGGDNLD